jgi:hypothetical protein
MSETKRRTFNTSLAPDVIESIKIVAAKQNVKPNIILENFAREGLAKLAGEP